MLIFWNSFKNIYFVKHFAYQASDIKFSWPSALSWANFDFVIVVKWFNTKSVFSSFNFTLFIMHPWSCSHFDISSSILCFWRLKQTPLLTLSCPCKKIENTVLVASSDCYGFFWVLIILLVIHWLHILTGLNFYLSKLINK